MDSLAITETDDPAVVACLVGRRGVVLLDPHMFDSCFYDGSNCGIKRMESVW